MKSIWWKKLRATEMRTFSLAVGSLPRGETGQVSSWKVEDRLELGCVF